MSFVQQQLGQSLDEFPYPILVEQWQDAYDHLKKVSWFYERPVEVEVEDPDVVRERQAQERVRAQYDAQQAAAKMQRDKAMPLNELGAEVSRQNKQFREQREEGTLPVRQPGTESRPISSVTFGLKAQARSNVALANPSLDRNGAEFSRLYAIELQKLRQQ